jgi:fatty-acyl-CoA synthase
MGLFQIRSIKDIEAIEAVPIQERVKARSTYELIAQGAAIDPQAPAMSFILSGDYYEQPMTVTYRDLMANIHRTANLLADLGIGPQDVVSYLLPNIPQTHYVLWGGEAAGVVNPINPLLEAKTIAEICRAAGTRILVALGDVPGSEIWPKVEAIRKELPDLKAILRVFGPGDEANGIYGFDELLPRYNAERLDSGRQIAPDERASMYHTGGTTGTPKLAPHTHFNEVAMAYMMTTAADFNTGETILCGLPLFHVNGTTVTGSFPFAVGGHTVLLSPRGYRDPSVMKNFFKIVAHYRAVAFSCVPTVLSVLLDLPVGDSDISSLRYVICGAAPLSVQLFQRFERHTGMKIIEGYGLTEGSCASSLNPLHGERKIGSIGLRIPYQEMKVMVTTASGSRDAAVDEIGSICIKGPNVFAGYLDPAHNRDIWPAPDWFNTGDLGRQDGDGYFWLTGRKKELIIRGGHNIDPAAIEEPLYRLPQVQVAAAVGRPDPHAGEVPVAYVQLQPGAKLTVDEIVAHLHQNVGERAALPKEVVILDEVPLTPVGKIFKPALRWDAIGKVYTRELEALGGLVRSVSVSVGEDKVHGALAAIRIRPAAGSEAAAIQARIDELLARYTVRYRIMMETP